MTDNKHEALITQIESMSAKELAEVVKLMEERFGITAGVPQVTAAGGAAAEEEKTSFNVLLKSAGDQKINVIKAIREATGLGLKEAKDLTDAAPKMVKEGLKKEEAADLKAKLEAAGATVELQ
ncbi:MAG: 50S ribosomal protein L7/L12 [Anaplasmataceae bacterium]|nr:50S ribosomal protein L7/L12 [Anaplasmataceae bacterium]